MLSYFLSILPPSLSKGTRRYFLSSAKFPLDVNCLAEISHFMNFLLVCRESSSELGWIFAAVKVAQGSEQSELPVQFTAWPHKELCCDGWWRQWGRGTRKEPDILESVLLPSKRNIESYCEILEILAFGCWKTDWGLKQSWAYFLLPHPFILNKIGDFFFLFAKARGDSTGELHKTQTATPA